MFPLVRYFSFTSFLVFFGAFVIIFYGLQRNSTNVLIDLREQNNISLTQAYANTIFDDHGEFIQNAGDMTVDAIVSEPEFLALDAELRQLNLGSSIIKVKIYATNGLTIYSSDPNQIGEDKNDNPGFQAGMSGNTASELVYADTFNAFEGYIEERDIVESYVSIRDIATSDIIGVIELYDDVTPLLNQINNRVRVLAATLATAFLVLYMILFTIVRYAERLMRRQHNQIQQNIIELAAANDNLSLANQRAEEATRLKSEFLSTMSHELRTPLNAIIGYSGIITSGIAGSVDERASRMVQRIQDSGQHLLMLINNVLDISKIEAGRLTIVKDKTNVRDMVESIGEQLQVLADEKVLSFNINVKQSVPDYLMLDSERVKQIVINLLSNAFKFTEKGSVNFDVSWQHEQLRLEVTDTGIGIPSHSLEYIFDEFRQVDGSSTRISGGTGLGLAIVRKFADAMDGKVSVQSTVGQGTTFIVTLPAKAISNSALDVKLPELQSND